MELRLVFEILLRRKKRIFIIFSLIFFTIVIGTISVPSRYDSTAKILLRKSPLEQSVITSFGGVETSSGSTISDTERTGYVEISTLRPILTQLTEELHLQRERVRSKILSWLPFLEPLLKGLGVDVESKYKAVSAEELADSSITSIIFPRPHVAVEQVTDTDILEITATSTDPEQAMLIANGLAERLRDYEIALNREEYKKYETLVQAHLKDLKDQYASSNRELFAFTERDKTLDLEARATALETMFHSLREGQEQNQIELKKTNASLKYLEERLKDAPEFSRSSETITTNEQIGKIKEQLRDYYLERAEKKLNYTDKHPSIKELDRKIEEAQKLAKLELDKVFSSQTNSIDPVYADIIDKLTATYIDKVTQEAQQKATSALLLQYEKQLLEMPEKLFNYALASLNESVNADLFKAIYTLSYHLRMAEVMSLSNIYILERAITPDRDNRKHKSPSLLLNTIIAFVLGSSFGVGGALLAEYMDDTITSRRDLRSYKNLVFLGFISRVKLRGGYAQEDFGKSCAPVKEEFRAIRNKLLFLSPESRLKSIAVVSSDPAEGKSFVSANLAMSLADAGMMVLLVDGDLRNPNLHELFKVSRKPGLTDYIKGDNTLGELIQESGKGRLSLLTSGTESADPAKFVESDKMEMVVKELENNYDVVVIDTPPMSESSDAVLLASKASGALSVLQYSKTTETQLAEMIDTLKIANANHLGTVLNQFVETEWIRP